MNCSNCGGYLVRNSDYYIVCENCGFCIDHDSFLNEVDEPNNPCPQYYKEARIVKPMPYKGHDRMQYFWKKFRFLEAKQKRILNRRIIKLFYKEKISDDFIIARKQIENILKNEGLANRYYKHASLIFFHLRTKRINIPDDFKTHAYRIYDEYQRKFNYNQKDSNKKKFIPWSYAMRKICYILDEQKEKLNYNPLDYIELFKDIKIEKNRKRNDQLWDNVRDLKINLFH